MNDEMVVLDISATRQNTEPDFELLEDISSQAFMPLGYGGGIKTKEKINIKNGIQKTPDTYSLFPH